MRTLEQLAKRFAPAIEPEYFDRHPRSCICVYCENQRAEFEGDPRTIMNRSQLEAAERAWAKGDL